ncbi:MAG TPA: protein meaA [Myxococcales bacterium]|nr:protein meaA [Deltaproteobacteria bacterium]HAA56496.1 protein meaA [Myxococcales bacterium]|tara:strand:- start:37286 stop:39310 length:2025 start_codon:yes stop_codon:yes gene_type:complete
MSGTDLSKKAPYHIYNDEGEVSQDRPWIMRTYAGHTNAKASNELFRENLSRGQNGLSIAFDLPTQCGYSSDHPLALPEVGKVGVPVNSIDDFRLLFDQIPLSEMNTSMTINGTSMWLLALYIALAEEEDFALSALRGTTQNDIIKEYLARGTYIFPPDAHFRMIAEMYEYSLERLPRWNASNICSYHLQEAGATPVQEISFALSTAVGILDYLKERGRFTKEQFEKVVGRISFFVNAGIRFVEEMCKMRAFAELWDEITSQRYDVQNPRYRRFRYGVQVNSLGLTAQQPENNAWRILIETLGVTLSRKARCRALQLPAWNEALSLPRPWDQQWSLRLQQILAHETDLLEYPDLFDGSPVIESKVEALKADVREEMARIEGMGGVRKAIESGYMKSSLVRSMSSRISQINNGELTVVGINRWEEGLPSPLLGDEDGGIFKVDASQTQAVLDMLAKTRQTRDAQQVEEALAALRKAAEEGENMMPASIACAHARVTTGEWTDVLREVFGEYRPTTGIEGQRIELEKEAMEQLRGRVESWATKRGHRPRIVVGKPGLDGHSNGAEMIAVTARELGFEVVYAGIRLTPDEIVRSALEEGADIIGVSLLSGSHLALAKQLIDALQEAGADEHLPVVIGGIIPMDDFGTLLSMGVKDVFTPRDASLSDIFGRILNILEMT